MFSYAAEKNGLSKLQHQAENRRLTLCNVLDMSLLDAASLCTFSNKSLFDNVSLGFDNVSSAFKDVSLVTFNVSPLTFDASLAFEDVSPVTFNVSPLTFDHAACKGKAPSRTELIGCPYVRVRI